MSVPSEKNDIWFSGMGNSPYGTPRAPGGKIRLLIVDDHAPYRKGLRSMFELEPDIEVVGEAQGGLEAIEKVEALQPDVALMDIDMQGMDGIQATRKLTDVYPGILIITLTMFKDEEHLREARRAGSSAYVLKDAGSEALLRTIRDVMSGETPLLQSDDAMITDKLNTDNLSEGNLSGDSAEGVRRRFPDDTLLTSNERAILKQMAEGLTNEEITQKTGLPDTMIRTYLTEIYRKLDIQGREAAMQYAREHGLLDE